MKLTEKDKNTILKAALTALDGEDLGSFRNWVVSLVRVVDDAEAAEGKSDVSVPVPQYVVPARGHAQCPQSHLWEDVA